MQPISAGIRLKALDRAAFVRCRPQERVRECSSGKVLTTLFVRSGRVHLRTRYRCAIRRRPGHRFSGTRLRYRSVSLRGVSLTARNEEEEEQESGKQAQQKGITR